MISEATVRQIKRLLEREMTQRKISSEVGVSRGTVSAIANGRRPDYEALRRAREEEKEQTIRL